MSRIWIVDSKNLLLKALRRWFQRRGYRVMSCSSLEEAHRRAAQVGRGVDVLLLDLTSTVLSESVLTLKLLIPDLKILVISERSILEWSVENSAYWHALEPGMAQILRSPFTAHELLCKVDDLLGLQSQEAGRPAGAA